MCTIGPINYGPPLPHVSFLQVAFQEWSLHSGGVYASVNNTGTLNWRQPTGTNYSAHYRGTTTILCLQ